MTTALEKALICGKKNHSTHYIAALTHITASIWRSAALPEQNFNRSLQRVKKASLWVDLRFGRIYAPENADLTHPFKLKELANLCAGSGEFMVIPTFTPVIWHHCPSITLKYSVYSRRNIYKKQAKKHDR
jgi:hypothetical protein